MLNNRAFVAEALAIARTKLEGCGGRNIALAEHVDALQAMLDEDDRQYDLAFLECDALDAAYADAAKHDEKMQAEAYEKDLRALVDAVRELIESSDPAGVWDLRLTRVDIQSLKTVLERFEPWLDGEEDENDHRGTGWVDDRGRP